MYASLNGIRLYYEVHGTGVPLVLLHGNAGRRRFLRVSSAC